MSPKKTFASLIEDAGHKTDEPKWSIPVSPDTYVADLDEFPREDRFVPEWMRAMVAGIEG